MAQSAVKRDASAPDELKEDSHKRAKLDLLDLEIIKAKIGENVVEDQLSLLTVPQLNAILNHPKRVAQKKKLLELMLAEEFKGNFWPNLDKLEATQKQQILRALDVNKSSSSSRTSRSQSKAKAADAKKDEVTIATQVLDDSSKDDATPKSVAKTKRAKGVRKATKSPAIAVEEPATQKAKKSAKSEEKPKSVAASEEKKGKQRTDVGITTKIVKDGVPLDEFLHPSYKTGYHILKEGDVVWEAKLNFSSLQANSNKFYLIQILEPDSGDGPCILWQRWGRLGYQGCNNIDHPRTHRTPKPYGPFSKEEAKRQFEIKFLWKTGSSWENRNSFTTQPGRYYYVQTSYEETVDKPIAPSTEKPEMIIPKCALNTRVQELVKLVCNVDEMARQMSEIGYDSKKLPLGKLGDGTLQHGLQLLQKLSDVISGNAEGCVNELSSQFYSVIPHDFGFQKMHNFVIRTKDQIKAKLEMLQSLSEVVFATRLLSDVSSGQTDPITAAYEKLQCGMDFLPASDEVSKIISRYVATTVGHTHTSYSLEVEDVFVLKRHGEDERFLNGLGAKIGNHQLLWHGSRLSNWVGILSQGLRIAPPEAPVTGYMFGKGIYFADMVSKSANYCFASTSRSTGLLVLSEVALGEMNLLQLADQNAGSKLNNKHSTKGVGLTAPTSSEMLPDGTCSVPMGPAIRAQGGQGQLEYNEYIVYRQDQVRMRYLVRVKFHFGGRRT